MRAPGLRTVLLGLAVLLASAASGDASEPAIRDLHLDVRINGRPLHLLAAFILTGAGALSARRQELEEIGLRVPERFGPDDAVALTELAGVTYRYDESAQAIDIAASLDALKLRVIDARAAEAAPPADPILPGVVVNYSLFASGGADIYGRDPTFEGASLALDGRAFGPLGTFTQTGILGSTVNEPDPRFLRLETSWQTTLPEAMLNVRLGDTITGGLAWTRPVRLAGVQVQRDFALRPDLVTFPLPSLRGSAAVPSTVDVLVNGSKAFSRDVDSGPFQLVNLPVLTGAGDAVLVVRDASGREVRTSMPLLVSSALLRPGLFDVSAEIGVPRRSYGSVSNDYDGDVAAVATLRYGISDALTAEAHAEANAALAVVGVGAVAGIAGVGTLSAAATASRTDGKTGTQVHAGVSRASGRYAAAASTTRTFGDFADLATVASRLTTAPDGLLYSAAQPPRALDRFSLALPSPFDGGSLNLSYIHADAADGTHHQFLNGSYARPILGRGSFMLSGMLGLGSERSATVYAGVSLPLGPAIASLALEGRHGATATATLESPRPAGDDQWGWRLRAIGASEAVGASGAVAYRTRYGLVEATLDASNQALRGSLQIDGAVAVAGGGVFATNRLDEAFAIVDTGLPNVGVRMQNQPVARSGADGKALVAPLPAYQASTLSLDVNDLPLDAATARTDVRVVPTPRRAVLVAFGVAAETRSAVVILHDAAGRPLPAGARGDLAAGRTFLVGHGGRAFIDNLEPSNRGLVRIGDASCGFAFDFRPVAGQQVEIGPVVCR
jgi:outer membrane usher protein